MSDGEALYVHKSILVVFVLCLFLGLLRSQCFAIDNPDAPDLMAEFQDRAKPFETDVQNQGLNASATNQAYFAYEKFLDQELNQTYAVLLKHISTESRKNPVDSQKRWLQFRDAEFLFIANNWTPQNFGSSYVISRGASRTKILRDRVIELLYYLKNY